MNQTLKNQIEKSLGMAFTDFKSEKDALTFLKDFLTEKEFMTFAKRLSVIYYLSKKRKYSNITNNLKVSSATIAKAKEISNKSSIKNIIKKIDADEWADKWSRKIQSLRSRS